MADTHASANGNRYNNRNGYDGYNDSNRYNRYTDTIRSPPLDRRSPPGANTPRGSRFGVSRGGARTDRGMEDTDMEDEYDQGRMRQHVRGSGEEEDEREGGGALRVVVVSSAHRASVQTAEALVADLQVFPKP
jgi:hypothetical protein